MAGKFQTCMKQELKGTKGKSKTVFRNALKKAAKKCAKLASKGIYPWKGPVTPKTLREIRQRIKRERAALAREEKIAIEFYHSHHRK